MFNFLPRSFLLFRYASRPQETYKYQGTRLSTQNMRERVCRSRGRDLITENSTKKSVCPLHKVIRERSCSIIYLLFKFLFSMKTRRAERVTCSLDSHFFQVQCSSNQFIRNVREKSKEEIADKLHSRRTDCSQVTQRWAKRGHAYRDYARGRLIDILLASLTAHAWPRETHIHTLPLSLFLKISLFFTDQCLHVR